MLRVQSLSWFPSELLQEAGFGSRVCWRKQRKKGQVRGHMVEVKGLVVRMESDGLGTIVL